jgi:hypothetical protein
LWETASVVWGLACWHLVPEFAGSNPAEAVGFFSCKNPQHAFLSHVPTLGHVKDPSFCGLNYGFLAKFVQVPSLANRGLSRRLMRNASGDDGRNHFRCGAQRACLHTA